MISFHLRGDIMTTEIEKLIFCENVKQLRKLHGLSKSKMAKLLGISTAGLSAIENGIIPPRMSCAVILRASDAFGIAPKELFKVKDRR